MAALSLSLSLSLPLSLARGKREWAVSAGREDHHPQPLKELAGTSAPRVSTDRGSSDTNEAFKSRHRPLNRKPPPHPPNTLS